MSSDNLIRQNYASYSTNPNSKYKPEELDKWANSSENYNSFINGEQDRKSTRLNSSHD